MFWNKKHKVQEGKETQILNIIKKLSEDEGTDVRLDPSNDNVFISNVDKHYDVVIFPSSVMVTNTTFSLREQFADGFIDLLKDIAKERASKDRQKVLDEILSREEKMLTTIENSL